MTKRLTTEQQELMLENRGLTFSFLRSKGYYGTHQHSESRDDIQDAATDGLLFAAMYYEPAMGTSFGGFAYKTMGQRCARAFDKLVKKTGRDERDLSEKQVSVDVLEGTKAYRIDTDALCRAIDIACSTEHQASILKDCYLKYEGDRIAHAAANKVNIGAVHELIGRAIDLTREHLSNNGSQLDDFRIAI